MKLTTVPSESSTTPAIRAHWIAQTAGYFGAFIALGLVASVLGPTLPELARHLQTSTQSISLLFTVRSFGYLLGSLQSGVLYDRYRGHPILAAATLGIAVLTALVPLAGALRDGASLIVFPEGTRRPELRPGPFRSGLYHLAREFPAVELIPVYLDNLNRAWPKGTLVPVPVSAAVLFGAPLRVEPGEPKEAFLARAREAVCALGRQMHPEAADG